MKKRVLFVAQNMHINGANKSLILLLENIDKSRYDIDIFLYIHEGILLDQIPSNVRLLPLDYYLSQCEVPLRDAIRMLRSPAIVIQRLFNIILNKLGKKQLTPKSRLYKESSLRLSGYDIAISYTDGEAVRFVVEQVEAKKKMGWIHVDMLKWFLGCDLTPVYSGVDKIICVSDPISGSFQQRCPSIDVAKIEVIHNIIAADSIIQQSKQGVKLDYSIDYVNILTVGRVNDYAKGVDIAMNAAVHLSLSDVNFKWYFVGPYKFSKEIEDVIDKNGIRDRVVFVGSLANPYPWIANCDIYVQPSRTEAWGLSLTEAKILNRPIVASNIEIFTEQITDGVNGLMADLTPEDFAAKIKTLIDSPEFRCRLKENLSKESLSNTSELTKLYNIIDE